MTNAHDWTGTVGDVWAEEWQRTDRSFAELAGQLNAAIADAAPVQGRALDIGCGAGSTSLVLAAARPDLSITGLDVSAALVAVARTRAAAFPAVDFQFADAATDPLPSPADLAVSRHGVMFFADPVAAFAHLHAAMTPDAPLVFSCFAEASANAFAAPLVAALTGTMPSSPSGYVPGPFAFADRDRTRAMLSDAGWQEADAVRVDYGYIAGEGADPIADAGSFLSRIGPVAVAIREASDRAAMLGRLAAELDRYTVGNQVVLPASAWLWRARA